MTSWTSRSASFYIRMAPSILSQFWNRVPREEYLHAANN
jgi:hypothetical protein